MYELSEGPVVESVMNLLSLCYRECDELSLCCSECGELTEFVL